MRARSISLRWSLLRGLLLLILLLSGAILLVTGWGARATVEQVVRTFTSTLAEQAGARIRTFYRRTEGELQSLAGWAANGTLSCTDPRCLVPLILPTMSRLPRIDSFSTGNDRGQGVLLLRSGAGWRVRRIDAENAPGKAIWQELDPTGRTLESWEEDLDYDPRRRPWFVPPSAPGGVHWTAPYSFFTTGEPGITVSLRVRGPDGGEFVVAYDILLEEISNMTAGLGVGRNGFAVVVDEAGRALGLPRDSRLADPASRRAALLRQVRDLGIPAARDVSIAVRERQAPTDEPFSFESGNETWWGEWRELRLDDDTAIYLGIAVPFSDFMGPARRNRWMVIGVGSGALLLAMLLALGLARRYARPLENLTAMSERLERLDTTPAPPLRTRIREIETLYGAQEKMRQALDSFVRYVPTGVVRDLLERGEAARLGGREAVLTVLFTDVRGFTGLAEEMAPSALVEHMGRYFEQMIDTLREGGATIDKLVGDSIVAFWGAPRSNAAHATDAVRTVQACRRRLAVQNERWRAEGRPELPTRFGLATGPVVVGNVGAPSRLHYTALGDTMNLASRLEAANEGQGTELLVARSTVDAAGKDWSWRRVDEIAVKGRKQRVEVFTLDLPPSAPPAAGGKDGVR